MGYEQKFASTKLMLGLRCRDIRKGKRILQRQLLDIVQLGKSHVSNIEHGKINLEFETLYKLKIGLRIEIAELFCDDNRGVISIGQFIYTDIETEKEKFSQRLIQLLEHRGVSQEDLSVMVKMGKGDIYLYTNSVHNIALLTMVKIAMALKIEVYDLFDYEGPLPDNNGYKQEEIEP